MRMLSPTLVAALASGASTLCRCWKLIRRDGSGLGFTDHDRDVAFGGLTYAAGTGLEGSEAESKIGLAVGGFELAGALTSAALTDADIAAGIWDGATVETWLVDWSDPRSRLLLDIGRIGEIRRGDHGFTAEVRGLAQAFDETRGRLYQARCSADLGDARCRIDLTDPRFTVSAAVETTDGRQTVTLAIGQSFAGGWFEGGKLTFTDGANRDAVFEIRAHDAIGDRARLVFWHPAVAAISTGDAVRLEAGCDKSLETCRVKFANALNFRGFPSIPTNDFVLTYARQGDSSQNGEVFTS